MIQTCPLIVTKAATSLYSNMVGLGIFCRGIFSGYVAEAYFGDMLLGQVSLFAQGELDHAKISRKRFYFKLCFSS